MDKFISPNQPAFLMGRLLVKGVMGVTEVVDMAKRTKRACLILKVDFDKVYGSVSWNFLIFCIICLLDLGLVRCGVLRLFLEGSRWPLAPSSFLISLLLVSYLCLC